MAESGELIIDLGVDMQEAISIAVELETAAAIKNVEELRAVLESSRKSIEQMGKLFVEAFSPAVNGLKSAQADLQSLTAATSDAANSVQALMSQLSREQQADTIWNAVSTSVDSLALALDAILSADKLKEVFSMLNSEDGLIATIGALIPSGAGIGVVTGALEEMRKKLVETANSWVELARVKKEDLATDVQKVATYVGEYAKGFASMAAGLASNAAAWVKNTAVMVASTAAQWAQTAATTAWQGICVAATAVTTAFGAAMQFLSGPIGIAVAAIAGVIAVVALLVANWDTVVAKTREVWGFVQQKLTEFGSYMTGVFAKDWSEQFGAFGHVLNGFFTNVKNIWESVKGIFGGIITFITNVFSGNWKKAWEGIKTVFSGVWNGLTAAIKTPINGMIGMVNMLISAVCSGVNGVIQVLNGLQFTIPDWVPVLGGNSYGFNIQPLKTPQIPYLAKGAVLPANRPFLAVVGDQRHGTNVEAPLTTIQEAVGLVMHDHIAAMMAGFEALLEEQRALRELVAEIEVGDDVIGRATERYSRKMAVVRGG